MSEAIQQAKATVLAYLDAMASAAPDTVAGVISTHTSADYHWRGMHPFHELRGAERVAEDFWAPLLQSVSALQRRTDVFFAGFNQAKEDGTLWVVSMGHLLGLFDQPWLSIPATGKVVMLRFAEFHQVAAGKIAKTAFFCDILAFMEQAGVKSLPQQTAATLVQPGPLTHAGLLLGPQSQEESAITLQLIRRMMDGIRDAGIFESQEEELRQFWHEDMLWWGPGGIGATYTIPRYVEQHARPFRSKLAERQFHGHVAFITEGEYGAFFGWPNLSMRNAGGFLGLPPANRRGEMRVTDVYRRSGNKLAENWIFIDMPHYLLSQDLVVLATAAAP